MMNTLQPVIKWSGSKRHIAMDILEYFPDSIHTYYEPFLGGGSVLGNMLNTERFRVERCIASDLCSPLIALWKALQCTHDRLTKHYTDTWKRLQEQGQAVYYEIRERFNREYRPEDFLFLSRTCMNGLIRFNKNGEFNSSFHLNRPGIDPKRFAPIIHAWSSLVRNVDFRCADYIEATKDATEEDLIYFDPPYASTKGMYRGTFNQTRFFNYLQDLNRHGVRWIMSYDGKRGDDDMTCDIPKKLYARHIYLDSGCSSFSRIKEHGIVNVKESLYLSW